MGDRGAVGTGEEERIGLKVTEGEEAIVGDRGGGEDARTREGGAAKVEGGGGTEGGLALARSGVAREGGVVRWGGVVREGGRGVVWTGGVVRGGGVMRCGGGGGGTGGGGPATREVGGEGEESEEFWEAITPTVAYGRLRAAMGGREGVTM